MIVLGSGDGDLLPDDGAHSDLERIPDARVPASRRATGSSDARIGSRPSASVAAESRSASRLNKSAHLLDDVDETVPVREMGREHEAARAGERDLDGARDRRRSTIVRR